MDIEKQVQQDIDKLVQYRNKLEQEKIIQEREINLNAAKELISDEYKKSHLTFWQKIKKYFSNNESENHAVVLTNIIEDNLDIEYINKYNSILQFILKGDVVRLYEYDLQVQVG